MSTKHLSHFQALRLVVVGTLVWVVCIVSVVLLAARARPQGFGLQVQRSGDLSGTIASVEFNHPGKLIITQGQQNRYSINGEDTSGIQDLDIYMENDSKLVIKPRGFFNGGSASTEIQLELIELHELVLNSSGQVEIKDRDTNILYVTVNGSGSVTGDINPDNLQAAINASGKIQLQGRARNAHLNINGSGNIDFRNFKIADATVSITGSGKAELDVDYRLKASILGSGHIRYTGNPSQFSENVVGSGSVEPVTSF